MTIATIRDTQTVADLLLKAAQEHPEAGLRYHEGPAAVPDARPQSYPELVAEARRVLTGLRERGLVAQDKVVLLLERPEEFLPAFWGCLLGGFVPVPMAPLGGDPERWAAQLGHVDSLLDRPLIVTNEKVNAELPHLDGLSVALLDALRAGEGAEAEELHRAAPEDTALLVLTSGSTGNSKAVQLTHANLLASMAAKNGVHRLTGDDITLNWVSFDHVAALLECHLLPLYAGATQLHVQAPVVLGDPLEFLRLISAYGVTMTFTPNFLLGLLNPAAEQLEGRAGAAPLSTCRGCGRSSVVARPS